MRIILQGGHYDGDQTDIGEHVGQFTPHGQTYKIVAGEFVDGRQVFRFDEKATLEGTHGKASGPRGEPTGLPASRPNGRNFAAACDV